eukprot:TRINITY_DN9461_c0_g1_i3.p1 TRINITY_DN9461_c0_g1~~TRINITY_DN9461_c0_g1_i3.p1  ORF type:complete len:417 (+),score=183.88 TRINITY_DN9461_c0_g1_i3:55-1305(+)
MKLAGDLACQNNGYLRSIVTQVVKCVAAKEKDHKAWVKNAVSPADSKPTEWWAVQLADTVLFPEGGGQPFDVGTIGESYCGNVQRSGMEVWHLTDRPLEEGVDVEVKLNWARRFDQMQQHTAQHMLTAVCEKELQLETMCWGMGTDISYIQLPTAKLSEEQIQRVEDICNTHIRDGLQTQVLNKTAEELGAQGASVPKDAGTGTLRYVAIPGVDEGPCCGTHVASLAHLQMLKLLHFEPKGNTLRLYFVAGGRVAALLHGAYHREKRIVKLVGTSADDLENAIQRNQKTATAHKKAKEYAFKELAVLRGEKLGAEAAEGSVVIHHEDDGDMTYLMSVADQVMAKAPTALVICSGDKKASGERQMLIACANADRLQAAAAQAAEVFQAKGGCNKGKWRGKLPTSKGMDKFEAACKGL